MSEVAKVENNTAHLITLAPTPSFPNGVTLRPGLNPLPEFYLEEAAEVVGQRVPKGAKKDPKTKRWATEEYKPVLAAFEELQKPVRFFTIERGWQTGPQITVYTAEQAPDRPDGPVPPESLEHLKDLAALKCIELMNDVEVLKRWARDSRKNVANMAQSRIAALR